MVIPKCLEHFGNFLDSLQVVTWILQPSLALSFYPERFGGAVDMISKGDPRSYLEVPNHMID